MIIPQMTNLILFFQANIEIEKKIISFLDDTNALSLSCKYFFLKLGKSLDLIIYKTILGQIDFSKVDKDFNLIHRNYIYLYLSIKFGHYDNVNFFLKYPKIVVESIGPDFLFAAIEEGYLDILKLLVNNGMDPSVNNSHALVRAVNHDKLDIVKYLINDERISLKSYHGRALKNACIHGKEKIIKLLLSKREEELPDLYTCMELAYRYPYIQKIIGKKLNKSNKK